MSTQRQKYAIPGAIVIAGLLIAGAVVLSSGESATLDTASNNQAEAGAGAGGRAEASGEFRMPSNDDHVRGNPDAPIAVVEFSDLECPFCARLHPTLTRIVEEETDVKWVYRHFPLSTIHSRALSAAVASECIAELGGNDAFWSFIDAAFANQRQLGDAWYREKALSFGIDADAFAGCTNDRSVVADIQRDLDEATGTGGRGTPHSVVVTASGELISFSGALPYEQVMSVIERARNI